MQPHSPPDIYLMKREKSRAGCMTLLIATAAAAALAGVFLLVQRPWAEKTPPPPAVDAPDAAPVPADAPPRKGETSFAPTTPAAPAPALAADAPAPAPASSPPDPAAAANAASLLSAARELHSAGNLQGARESALAALDLLPGNPEIETFLSELAMPLLFSRHPMPEKTEYVVQSGDYLGKIASAHNTPVPLIARANAIQGALIHPGQTLLLLDGRNHAFSVHVSKSRNDLLLALDGKFFKRYPVATGRDGKTPAGAFKIIDKIEHPPWHKPGGLPIPYGDPENQLGTHWLAIDMPGYGLHGTWDPDSVGSQTSDGCIRMFNDEIEELYSILPRGTPVIITE
jgi:lipoprotein-anchoring transpeptidase ErfK/SrfK